MPAHGAKLGPPTASLTDLDGVDLMARGLQLALFIIPERSIALQVLANAMSKLRAQQSREKKRTYWRDKHLKRKITRIARNEQDALQWLIYFEAERFEKQQEELGVQTTRDMIVRYIKHLVQLTTAMSSFYVNVGLHRLLYNYSTSEARTVYEWVTQHYPGDQEYRNVKATLMKRLHTRFKHFIRTCTVEYGETRFEVLQQQSRWSDLVLQCLRAFTPWSTRQTCSILGSVDGQTETLPYPLTSKNGEALDRDVIETNRCHVFIEPRCHESITRKLGLDPPLQRLAIPQFFAEDQRDARHESGGPPEDALVLRPGERQQILDRLNAETQRRRGLSAKSLRILADGTERLHLDAVNRRTGCFKVEEGATLIEIWAEDRGQNVLLAAHWVEYTQSQGIARGTAIVDLGERKELSIEIMPFSGTADEPGGASITARYQPVGFLARWREAFEPRFLWLNPKYAFGGLALLAIGWVLGSVRYAHELQSQRASVHRLQKELAQEIAAREALEHSFASYDGEATEAFALTPNDLRTRDAQSSKEPVISLSPQAAQVVLELPLDGPQKRPYRAVLKPFFGGEEILAESFPNPARVPGEDKLRFILPASFVDNGTHYLITLETIGATGRVHKGQEFPFYVKKEIKRALP